MDVCMRTYVCMEKTSPLTSKYRITYTCIHTYTRTCTDKPTDVHMHAYIHILTQLHCHTCTCTYIITHTQTYMHIGVPKLAINNIENKLNWSHSGANNNETAPTSPRKTPRTIVTSNYHSLNNDAVNSPRVHYAGGSNNNTESNGKASAEATNGVSVLHAAAQINSLTRATAQINSATAQINSVTRATAEIIGVPVPRATAQVNGESATNHAHASGYGNSRTSTTPRTYQIESKYGSENAGQQSEWSVHHLDPESESASAPQKSPRVHSSKTGEDSRHDSSKSESAFPPPKSPRVHRGLAIIDTTQLSKYAEDKSKSSMDMHEPSCGAVAPPRKSPRVYEHSVSGGADATQPEQSSNKTNNNNKNASKEAFAYTSTGEKGTNNSANNSISPSKEMFTYAPLGDQMSEIATTPRVHTHRHATNHTKTKNTNDDTHAPNVVKSPRSAADVVKTPRSVHGQFAPVNNIHNNNNNNNNNNQYTRASHHFRQDDESPPHRVNTDLRANLMQGVNGSSEFVSTHKHISERRGSGGGELVQQRQDKRDKNAADVSSAFVCVCVYVCVYVCMYICLSRRIVARMPRM